MILYEAKTMKAAWVQFCMALALREADEISGVQKIVHHVSMKVPGDLFFDGSIDLSMFGYSERGNKMESLKRHYLDRDKMLASVGIIEERVEQSKYGSCGFPLTGEVKKWTKQDFCMQAATVTNYKDGLRVVVFYRTTEVIKKFGADLIFLRDVVLPRFNDVKSISSVTFSFSNVTVHPMFFPTLLSHVDDPVSFLKGIKSEDRKFHEGIEKWMTKYILEGEGSWVQKFSQARQTHAAMLRLMHKKKQRDLRKYFTRGSRK